MVVVVSLVLLVWQAAGGGTGNLATQGRSWEQFLQGVRMQRDLWLRTEARVSIAPELVARVERARRGLQLIVVAEDWCPDSAYTVPYVARLATLAGVPLSLVDRTAGEAWLRAHRTGDGRTATPTIVLLRDGVDVGAWVERPAVLQDMFRSIGDSPAAASQFARRGEWYEADHGTTALGEIVTLIEQTGGHR
jgi:hypothetical protein